MAELRQGAGLEVVQLTVSFLSSWPPKWQRGTGGLRVEGACSPWACRLLGGSTGLGMCKGPEGSCDQSLGGMWQNMMGKE